MTSRPKLSVLLPVPVPWPEYRPNLVELRRQVAELDAELLLLDGSPNGSPEPPAAELVGVRYIRPAARDVFELRAIGTNEARGDIIAITEDHCLVARDWCARLIELHAEYPDALANKLRLLARDEAAYGELMMATQAKSDLVAEAQEIRLLAELLNELHPRSKKNDK